MIKITEPHVEILPQPRSLNDVWRNIRIAAQICYHSDGIGDMTDEEWCRKTLIKDLNNLEVNHLTPFEHGTLYLIIPDSVVNSIGCESIFSPYTIRHWNLNDNNWYVTTNMRVLLENEEEFLLDYISECNPDYHVPRISVIFDTNIGVSRELNRHRKNSVCEQSTRYCNYTKDKFDGNVNYMLPAWLNKNETERTLNLLSNFDFLFDCNVDLGILVYLKALIACNDAYKKLIQLGWKPQQAREVLPLATRTKLIHTASIIDWLHFLKLREEGVSGAPHPNMKVLANELRRALEQEDIVKNYL